MEAGSFDALIREEAHRSIKISDNGRTRTVSVMQAVLRRVAFDALQGRSRAQKLLLSELVAGAKRRNDAQFESFQQTTIE